MSGWASMVPKKCREDVVKIRSIYMYIIYPSQQLCKSKLIESSIYHHCYSSNLCFLLLLLLLLPNLQEDDVTGKMKKEDQNFLRDIVPVSFPCSPPTTSSPGLPRTSLGCFETKNIWDSCNQECPMSDTRLGGKGTDTAYPTKNGLLPESYAPKLSGAVD